MAQQSSITTFFSTPCIRHISEVDGLEAVGEEHDETDLEPKTKFQRVCPSQTEEGAMTSNADTQSEDRLGENTTGALGNHALDIYRSYYTKWNVSERSKYGCYSAFER